MVTNGGTSVNSSYWTESDENFGTLLFQYLKLEGIPSKWFQTT